MVQRSLGAVSIFLLVLISTLAGCLDTLTEPPTWCEVNYSSENQGTRTPPGTSSGLSMLQLSPSGVNSTSASVVVDGALGPAIDWVGLEIIIKPDTGPNDLSRFYICELEVVVAAANPLDVGLSYTDVASDGDIDMGDSFTVSELESGRTYVILIRLVGLALGENEFQTL